MHRAWYASLCSGATHPTLRSTAPAHLPGDIEDFQLWGSEQVKGSSEVQATVQKSSPLWPRIPVKSCIGGVRVEKNQFRACDGEFYVNLTGLWGTEVLVNILGVSVSVSPDEINIGLVE